MTEITSRLSTALADRYRIERHLGEGGMFLGGVEGEGGELGATTLAASASVTTNESFSAPL